MICVLNTSGTTFICTLHIHIAAIATIITQDLLPSDLVAQSAEKITATEFFKGTIRDMFSRIFPF